MHYTLDVETVVSADHESVWRTWTDMERFPEWDPREEETRLDAPFGVGATGWSKQKGTSRSPIRISAVEPGALWQVETPLPGGKLVIDHRVDDAGDGRVRLSKRYVAYGPVSLAFRAYYGRRIRREMPASFAALVAESRRRAGE
ncbi:SRPBCC family protein [Yinghuangia seranimata]|uniref:SRPBCC family protein n=1 Tax=Yinghuangia seranimata TaxID=408067 RepID=UPI00248B7BCF|nr:SRPBCC family protein [Yinghuangia seranimata]MDI2128972.1 SRPBCC family protein [Yinghuangia seranimata]